MNEHIAELFDKYCTARDCDTCKYNKDKRVVSGDIPCNKAYEDDLITVKDMQNKGDYEYEDD